MRIGSKLALLALIIGAAVVSPVFAEEQPAGGAPDFEKLFKDVDKVLTLNFTADDIKTFKDNWGKGEELLKDDKEFLKLKQKNIKECFDYVIKNEAFLKWCKDNKIEGDGYLRKSLRIMFQHHKLGAADMIKSHRDALAAERKEKDAALKAGEMTEAEMKEYIAAADAAYKTLESMEKGVALIPAPTDAEKKLLEDNKADIQKLIDSDKSN